MCNFYGLKNVQNTLLKFGDVWILYHKVSEVGLYTQKF